MTGFGRGVAERQDARATVDIRAVNHRFLDLKLRGAPVAPSTEDAIAARIRDVVERGAVTVSVHVVRPGVSARIDEAVARAVHDKLAALARTLGTAPPDLALVLAQPGVVAAADDDRDASGDPAVLAALEIALTQLGGMREIEGAALARELAARLGKLAAVHGEIALLAETVPAQAQRRLHERLRRLGVDEAATTDANAELARRLAQEVALLADRADITEELVRLASHLDQARALLASKEPAGRRLDFLVQELGRELNTIGSKAPTAEITALVVDGKAVLEKVREQVQNVE